MEMHVVKLGAASYAFYYCGWISSIRQVYCVFGSKNFLSILILTFTYSCRMMWESIVIMKNIGGEILTDFHLLCVLE